MFDSSVASVFLGLGTQASSLARSKVSSIRRCAPWGSRSWPLRSSPTCQMHTTIGAIGSTQPDIVRIRGRKQRGQWWDQGLMQERGRLGWGQFGLRSSSPVAKRYASTSGGRHFGDMTEEEYSKSKNRYKELKLGHISQIFGPGMTAKQGNGLLDTLQKQRVTGTLDLDIQGPNINKATIAKGLQWLRHNYKLDEDAAIMARIEREEAAWSEWKPQQDASKSSTVYGESGLDKIRVFNEAKAKEREEAEKKEEQELTKKGLGPTSVIQDQKTFRETIRSTESAEWVKKYKEQALLSKMQEAPNPSAWQVLGPSTAVMLAILAGCVMFANEYETPLRQSRLFPDTPPAVATVATIIGLNVLVFLMWKAPPLWRFLNANFLMIPATMNPFTLLGNVFSHQGLFHLAANMGGLWFLGNSLCDEIGRGRFLAIYIAAGVFGSWLSLVRFVLIGNYQYTMLGASGAVMGVIGTYCSLYPNARISSPIIPSQYREYLNIRADVILGLLITAEIIGIARKSFRVDHVAHLGGLLTGATSAEIIRRRARERRRLARSRPTVVGS